MMESNAEICFLPVDTFCWEANLAQLYNCASSTGNYKEVCEADNSLVQMNEQ